MDFPDGQMNLYLTDIKDPSIPGLKLVVTEGELGPPEKIDFGDVDLGEGRPIIITPKSRRFEIFWAVRNESYWKAEPNETFRRYLEQRYNSAFLRYVSNTTFADDSYPGPLQHWGLSTLNHCVDVVSVHPPRVRLINGDGS